MNIDVQYQGKYILVKYRGPANLEIGRNIFQVIVESCNKYDCFNVLMIAYLENSVNPFENYNLYEVVKEVGFSHHHRLAWVDENPETLDSTEFAETVLTNRGLQVRVLKDVKDAKQWLIKE